MKKCIFAFAATLCLFSCKKNSVSEIQTGDTGSIILEFDNVVGPNDIQLNTATYSNALNEQFTVSTLDYFVSNIRLKKIDGSEYIVPRDSSYFLIKEDAPGSHEIRLSNIPAGDYSSFSFVIGVDSLKNVAPISERTGVLDPAGQAAGMYWTWNSGYIFLKMEGSSPASTTDDKKIYYHIGGFGGFDSPTMNNIKTVTLEAPAGMTAKIRKDAQRSPVVHIFADASKILDGDTNVSIAQYSMVHFADISATIANNYATMFSIDHIHND